MIDSGRLRSLFTFAVVGGVTVLIDAATYALLLHLEVAAAPAKAVGFMTGAVFAYVANWRFTFGARRSRYSEVLFVLVYVCALALNIGVNALVRGLVAPLSLATPIAFVVATSASAAWNFVGMSMFVFRRREDRPDVV